MRMERRLFTQLVVRPSSRWAAERTVAPPVDLCKLKSDFNTV